MPGQRALLLAMLVLGALVHLSKEEHVQQAKIPLLISEAHEGDLPFAFSAWKNSSLDAPKNREKRDSGRVGEHFTQYNRDVHRIMATPAAKLLIAREPSDPDFIYGWIAFATYYDPTLTLPRVRRARADRSNAVAILYTYCKSKFRRMGVARELKDAALQLAPEHAQRFFCESTVHDGVFERWGFVFKPFEDVYDLCANPRTPRAVRRTA